MLSFIEINRYGEKVGVTRIINRIQVQNHLACCTARFHKSMLLELYQMPYFSSMLLNIILSSIKDSLGKMLMGR